MANSWGFSLACPKIKTPKNVKKPLNSMLLFEGRKSYLSSLSLYVRKAQTITPHSQPLVNNFHRALLAW